VTVGIVPQVPAGDAVHWPPPLEWVVCPLVEAAGEELPHAARTTAAHAETKRLHAAGLKRDTEGFLSGVSASPEALTCGRKGYPTAFTTKRRPSVPQQRVTDDIDPPNASYH
jgi:hypothetical protein